MELLEMVGWVALGFLPTLGALEVVNRKLATIRHATEVSLFVRGGKIK
jgi:hypothetical protein